MKKIFLFISILLVASNTFSQSTFDKAVIEASTDLANKLIQKNKKKLVVLYVTDISRKQTVAGKYIADVISVNIVNDAGNFEIFDRENLSGIAEAKKLIAEGYIDVDKAKELGKILAVETIVIGNYTVLSKTLKLTLKAFDSNSGLVIAATGKELPIDSNAGALLGINVEGNESNNRGFNNRPLNSNENYNNPETVNKDCESSNTGDYCFTNNTEKNLIIYVNKFNSIGGFNMTLDKGQTQCAYNLKAQQYEYNIQTVNYDATFAQRKGQILVEKCKSKTFIIK